MAELGAGVAARQARRLKEKKKRLKEEQERLAGDIEGKQVEEGEAE
jgi:hypothetical protein